MVRSEEPSIERVRLILFKHAVNHGVISPDEPRLGNDPPHTLSMTQSANLMGVGYERARKLAGEAGLIPRGSRRSVAFTIDPDALEKLHLSVNAQLSSKSAWSILCTGKLQLIDLVENGLLVRKSKGGIDRASLDRLMDRLIRQCCGGSRPSGLSSLAIAARNASVPLWRICQAALEGVIPCWQTDGDGLSQFVVRVSDVLMLRETPRGPSIEATARRLGIHSDCARALARCGTFSDDAGQLSLQKIDLFERDFVIGSQVARECGCSSRALIQRLGNLGLLPAFDLTTHRQAIYRRSDLSRLGLLQ